MRLAWHWCAKEWRAQRAFVGGYVALMVATIAAGATLAHWRGLSFDGEQRRSMVVLWFAATTALGAFFAAGHAVRGELVGAGDQLWRRLPGALWPAFLGKGLFLAMLLPALALAGGVAGEAYLWAMALRPVSPQAVVSDLLRLRPELDLAIALLPWVFALALWMPGARFALGATAVLAGGFLVAVGAVLHASRGLAETLPAAWLTPWVLALGVGAAWTSCVRGRRGGDHRRSAFLGAAMAVIGLLPPGAWFGSWLHAYWRPDVARLRGVAVRGVTADGSYALVWGAAHPRWPDFAARVDLRTGATVRLTSPEEHRSHLWEGWVDPRALAREGVLCASDGRSTRLLDFVAQQSYPLSVNTRDAVLRERLDRISRTCSLLRQPGDVPAWIDGGDLCLANADGSVTRERLPGIGFVLVPAGHGFYRHTSDEKFRHYDLTLRRHVELPADGLGHVAVRGVWLLRPEVSRREQGAHPTWRRFDPGTAAAKPIDGLPAGSDFLALLDDDRALFRISRRGEQGRLVAYDPARDMLAEVALPEHPYVAGTRVLPTTGGANPYGARDPRGRLLVYVHRPGRPGTLIATLDPKTLACEVLLAAELLTDVVAFEPAGGILCCEGLRRLVRYDATGAQRTVLYPR